MFKKFFMFLCISGIVFYQTELVSAIVIEGSGGEIIEVNNKNIDKLSKDDLEKVKMQIPQDFRIRGVLRDENNKPLSNTLVKVNEPESLKYATYTDENGLFGLNFTGIVPGEIVFIINETYFKLKKMPSSLSTYNFKINVSGNGLVQAVSDDIFLSSDVQYENLTPIIKPNPYFLGIQNSLDAFYFGLSIFLLIFSLLILMNVRQSVSDETINL